MQGGDLEAIPTAEVLICVHNALDDVRHCLASFAVHTDHRHHLILVDDASDPACGEELEQYAYSHPTTILLRNDSRMGYTRSANRGLRTSRAGFVVLLNSDTIVTPDWLEHLLECAVSHARIGLVGPLSNAAAFQSVPERYDREQGWLRNPLPGGWQPDDVAHAIAAIAPRAFPRVGVLNGFCLLIKRAVIEAIGYFDEEAFPNGYGEEHDYCLRASATGFELAVADHAYVYHAGTRSYHPEQRQELKAAARAALTGKHGAKRIRKAVARTHGEPTLERMRHGAANALRQASPLPESPLLAPGGAAKVIVSARDSNLWVRAQPADGVRSSPTTVPETQETVAAMSHHADPVGPRNRLIWSFMGELDTQCANAELAYTALVMALSERDPDGGRSRAQQRKIFFYAHAFLTNAALIANILWPSSEVREQEIEKVGPERGEALQAIRKERGKRLRKALGKEISRLKDLGVAEYLERYDARVEIWSLLSPSAEAKAMVVSPMEIDDDGEPDNVVRHFDPVTMIYTFLGESFDLPAIAAALGQTHLAIARWASEQRLEEAAGLAAH